MAHKGRALSVKLDGEEIASLIAGQTDDSIVEDGDFGKEFMVDLELEIDGRFYPIMMEFDAYKILSAETGFLKPKSNT